MLILATLAGTPQDQTWPGKGMLVATPPSLGDAILGVVVTDLRVTMTSFAHARVRLFVHPAHR